jgi:hypothetical protein
MQTRQLTKVREREASYGTLSPFLSLCLSPTHESGGSVILLGPPFQLETIQGKWKVSKVNCWFRLEGIFLNCTLHRIK